MRLNNLINVITILEVLIIIGILIRLIQINLNRNVLSINTINSNHITKVDVPNAKFYYEPIQGVYLHQKPWQDSVTKITINSDTLNERFDYEIKKEKNTIRLLSLGDSFTYGDNVNTTENWSEQLEDTLKEQCSNEFKFEVINLGVGGYDLEYGLIRFITRGAKYNPDMVIWTITDPLRLNEQIFERQERLSQLPKLELIKKYRMYVNETTESDYEIDITQEFLPWFIARKEVIQSTATDQILNKNINLIQKMMSTFNGKILFIMIPPGGSEMSVYLKLVTLINKQIYNTRHKLIEVNLNDSYRLADMHFNVKGHDKMTSIIFTEIFSNYACKQ